MPAARQQAQTPPPAEIAPHERKFVTTAATRRRVPLWIGLNSRSGGGKTKSALRLAAGMQKVVGGKVHVLDAENDRALHYADWFEQSYGQKFEHTHFDPPFGSLHYLQAVRHCIANDARVMIIDSMSHEHDGIGGLLESHEAEIDRMQAEQEAKRREVSSREELSRSAWKIPKMNRRRMINEFGQMNAIFIYCFRAKDKSDYGGGKKAVHLGWMPVSGDDLIFEMTVNALLPPLSKGVPDWKPKFEGERGIVKVGPFEQLFARSRQFDEEIGAQMAKWSLGDAPPLPSAAAQQGTAPERAALIREAGKLREALGWDLERAKEWRVQVFGEADPSKLSVQQLDDAKNLLDLLTTGQDEYDAELASLIELGRIKVVKS